MNIEKLRCFKTVAETKHLTHAAESLFMSQPALSKLMASLESELNISLYEKEGRNIVLAEAGKVFYPHVVTALHELDEGIMAAQHEVAVKNNTVFLSAIISAYNNCLPSLLAEFRRQNLDCRFAVEYKYTTRILQEPLDGKCDLGVCGDFPENADFAALERTLLWKNPCTLIVGKNHRFASMDKVRVEDLRNETFVIWNRSNLGTNKDLSHTMHTLIALIIIQYLCGFYNTTIDANCLYIQFNKRTLKNIMRAAPYPGIAICFPFQQLCLMLNRIYVHTVPTY